MRFPVTSNETDANSTIIGNIIFNYDNASAWNQTLTHHAATSSSRSISSNIFFIIPGLGLLVLCYGSCYLRNRRIRQSRQSSIIYDARLRAMQENIQIKKALRLEMVENALVTTKVIRPNSNRYHRRGSSNLTVSTSNSLLLDSLGSTTRSMIESQCNDEEAQGSMTNDACDEKLQKVHNSSKCSAAASQVLNAANTEPLTLEHPIRRSGWKLEAFGTCVICLESYQENDSVSYSRHQNCTHAFHTECIMNWLTSDQYRNDCPCCRGQYVHICVVESDEDIFGGEALSSSSRITDEEQAGISVTQQLSNSSS